jgi:hypothetical protein
MPDLIPQDQIKNATLFSSRYDFIKTLPKEISYLEAGVLAGDFSLKVIETINPKISYLVEPFFEIDWHAPEYGGPRWGKAEDHYSFILNRFKNIKNVKIYKGTFEDFFKENKQDKIDFIYMDYNTDYFSVEKQLLMGAEILSDDGVLGFNDYNIYFNNTVTGEKMGVVPAINDFLRNNSNWYVYAFALNDNLTSDIYLKKLQ